MTRHAIEIDVDEDRRMLSNGHFGTFIEAYAAFCTEECRWKGDWHHLDNYGGETPEDQAYAEAKHDGLQHLHDEGQPTADRPTLPGMVRLCRICGEAEGSDWSSDDCQYEEVGNG